MMQHHTFARASTSQKERKDAIKSTASASRFEVHFPSGETPNPEREGEGMSSVCKSSVVCVDARVPVRATYVNLYKWPESDAEFVKWVAGRRREEGDNSTDGRTKWGPSPRVVDSYSCRQMYLRSYTFSKKESFPEKTQRCLGKVKERAAVCQRSDSLPSSVRSNISHKDDDKRKKKKKKKKGTCVAAAKKLLDFIFRRLLSCTSSVDVVDRSSPS